MIDRRLDNGVRARFDGQGDPWSNQHRINLGNRFTMGDIDGFAGLTVWASDSEDALFSEYVVVTQPGPATVHAFATVAFFDRKKGMGAIDGRPGAHLSLDYQLDMLNKLGAAQLRMPRFFYVIGEAVPWTLVEVDIRTRRRSEPIPLFGDAWHWRQTWAQLGLVALRDELARWLVRA